MVQVREEFLLDPRRGFPSPNEHSPVPPRARLVILSLYPSYGSSYLGFRSLLFSKMQGVLAEILRSPHLTVHAFDSHERRLPHRVWRRCGLWWSVQHTLRLDEAFGHDRVSNASLAEYVVCASPTLRSLIFPTIPSLPSQTRYSGLWYRICSYGANENS